MSESKTLFIINRQNEIEEIDERDYQRAHGLKWRSIDGAQAQLDKINHIHNVVAPEFEEKLYALLKEYNASISFSVSDCSDTHGLYDEKMVVNIAKDGVSEEVVIENGWAIG